MDEQPQSAGEDVGQMVEELHVHHHGFVAHDKGAIITHETEHEHDLIDQLRKGTTVGLAQISILFLFQQDDCFCLLRHTVIYSTVQMS